MNPHLLQIPVAGNLVSDADAGSSGSPSRSSGATLLDAGRQIMRKPSLVVRQISLNSKEILQENFETFKDRSRYEMPKCPTKHGDHATHNIPYHQGFSNS